MQGDRACSPTYVPISEEAGEEGRSWDPGNGKESKESATWNIEDSHPVLSSPVSGLMNVPQSDQSSSLSSLGDGQGRV